MKLRFIFTGLTIFIVTFSNLASFGQKIGEKKEFKALQYIRVDDGDRPHQVFLDQSTGKEYTIDLTSPKADPITKNEIVGCEQTDDCKYIGTVFSATIIYMRISGEHTEDGQPITDWGFLKLRKVADNFITPLEKYQIEGTIVSVFDDKGRHTLSYNVKTANGNITKLSLSNTPSGLKNGEAEVYDSKVFKNGRLISWKLAPGTKFKAYGKSSPNNGSFWATKVFVN